jgi:hypothetical protein
MMLNIKNVVRNVMYSIVYSMGIIWGIKEYRFDYFSLISSSSSSSSSLKMIKIDRIVSELWKIVCKNAVFISVHLLVPMCEENKQSKIFYKNTNESATILTYSDASKNRDVYLKQMLYWLLTTTQGPLSAPHVFDTRPLRLNRKRRSKHVCSHLSCMEVGSGVLV